MMTLQILSYTSKMFCKVIMANEEIYFTEILLQIYVCVLQFQPIYCTIPGETPSGQHPKYDTVQLSALMTSQPSKLGPVATLIPSGQQP